MKFTYCTEKDIYTISMDSKTIARARIVDTNSTFPNGEKFKIAHHCETLYASHLEYGIVTHGLDQDAINGYMEMYNKYLKLRNLL